MAAGKPLRVLHGPVNVGNQPWTLSRAERRAGLASDLVVTRGDWLGYNSDRNLARSGGRLSQSMRRLGFGLSAPLTYDVLHLYFGEGFLRWRRLERLFPSRFSGQVPDVHLAKRLGCKVFMTLQGCDVRIAAHSNARNAQTACVRGRCSLFDDCISRLDANRLGLVTNLLPFCDRVFYLNPELGHEVANATFLPYASVDLAALVAQSHAPKARRRPRVVHAPTNPSIKGTKDLLAALEALQETYPHDLVLVENKPHAEALEIYRDADLVLDQIWLGWYGGLSVEVMALGKPVGCYIRPEDLRFVPEAMQLDLPVLQLRPDHLREDLSAIFARQEQWPEIGRQSRAFVEAWHDPDLIARALAKIYRDPMAAFEMREDVPSTEMRGSDLEASS